MKKDLIEVKLDKRSLLLHITTLQMRLEKLYKNCIKCSTKEELQDICEALNVMQTTK